MKVGRVTVIWPRILYTSAISYLIPLQWALRATRADALTGERCVCTSVSVPVCVCVPA